MPAVEFWFEFASTYSYPAAMRVGRMAEAQGVELVWRPFLLGPLLFKQGLTDTPFNVFEQKGRYMWRDLERIAMAEGLPFKKPSHFPQNGLLASRLTLVGLKEGWGPDFVRAVYQANFAKGAIISEVSVLAEILDTLGQDSARILEAASTPAIKGALKAQTDLAWEKGIFGAPSILVGDELFWGNDRMEAAFAWAAR
ncbi:MAG: 2-hydroxychromene-2-carboxylate isomerase [Parvibaculum sp.]